MKQWPKQCTNCLCEFSAKQPWSEFCSKRCGVRFRSNKRKQERLELIPKLNCRKCGKEFTPFRTNKTFCSARCQETQSRKGRTRNYPNTLDYKAKRLWGGMIKRTKTYKSYLEKNIKVTISKEEFLSWCIPALDDYFKAGGMAPASIDRIDPNKNYEFGNIRILNADENSMRCFLSRAYKNTGPNGLIKAIADLCQSENLKINDLVSRLSAIDDFCSTTKS